MSKIKVDKNAFKKAVHKSYVDYVRENWFIDKSNRYTLLERKYGINSSYLYKVSHNGIMSPLYEAKLKHAGIEVVRI